MKVQPQRSCEYLVVVLMPLPEAAPPEDQSAMAVIALAVPLALLAVPLASARWQWPQRVAPALAVLCILQTPPVAIAACGSSSHGLKSSLALQNMMKVTMAACGAFAMWSMGFCLATMGGTSTYGSTVPHWMRQQWRQYTMRVLLDA